MEKLGKKLRVLSVQSHVVSGYAGNKSACFPLQVLGFDVDFINSVQFSNHTGYKYVKGQVLKSEDLEELYDGLKSNDILKYTHVLTGYVGNVSFLSKLVEIIVELKSKLPNLQIVCDPVMGDDGKMYVPDEVLPIYRDYLIPISDVITPNQYEAELLTGIQIKCKDDVLRTLDSFHSMGVVTVVVSSIRMEKKLVLYASTIKNGAKTVIFVDIPELDSKFTGTGDLFTALFLAWMEKTKCDIKDACEKVVNTMQCVLTRTLDHSKIGKDPFPFNSELKLIQSKNDIENPPNLLKCEQL